MTSEEWFGIPKDRLYVTIFEGTADGLARRVPRDDEAEKYWLEVGVPKERIGEYGLKDNFWQMGETGPCGPCSEIFYDMGLEAAETPGVDKPFGQDDARYVEIWNLVFMQFDRSAVVDAAGKTTGYKLTPLPKPSIDTGMGLERVAAVLQGKVSNFETDLFTPLIVRAEELTGKRVSDSALESETRTADDDAASLRIIADHARAATFLINDGVLPSNEGRGYVLGKILRRAIRHGRLLGQEKPFLFEMVYAVRNEMKGAYPELVDSAERVAKVVEAEEKQFARVLEAGTRQLDSEIRRCFAPTHVSYYPSDWKFSESEKEQLSRKLEDLVKGRSSADISDQEIAYAINGVIGNAHGPVFNPIIWRDLRARLNAADPHDLRRFSISPLDGARAFHLYETYGLPLDFMVDAARDAGVGFDYAGFEAAKSEEQARARASWKGGSQKTASPVFRDVPRTVFEGYRQLTSTNCEVLAIMKNGIGFLAAKAGQRS